MAEELHNVSRAGKVMGVSRDTFYRYRELPNEGGVDALISNSKRVSNLKNRVDEAAEHAVTEIAIEFPAYGQLRVSNELKAWNIRLWQWRAFNLGEEQSGELQKTTHGLGRTRRSRRNRFV